jgi:D-glycero-D-manno-heptose 1,7-bisphosphate phosphatase
MGECAITAGSRRAVFLDRDGVLNYAVIRGGRPYPPSTADDMRIVDNAAAHLAALKRAGFLLIVVTNQPDIARGRQSRETVDAMHSRLFAELPLDDVFVCDHDDLDGCSCRKPAPGLLIAAAAKHGIDLARSFMIGDRWRDVDAGAAAGCRTILLDAGYAERAPAHAPSARVTSLEEAAAWILQSL